MEEWKEPRCGNNGSYSQIIFYKLTGKDYVRCAKVVYGFIFFCSPHCVIHVFCRRFFHMRKVAATWRFTVWLFCNFIPIKWEEDLVLPVLRSFLFFPRDSDEYRMVSLSMPSGLPFTHQSPFSCTPLGQFFSPFNLSNHSIIPQRTMLTTSTRCSPMLIFMIHFLSPEFCGYDGHMWYLIVRAWL